jgi:hypothetical protein
MRLNLSSSRGIVIAAGTHLEEKHNATESVES